MDILSAYAGLKQLQLSTGRAEIAQDQQLLRQLISISSLCNTHSPGVSAPEIESELGDLRELLLTEFKAGRSANILFVFVSTNLGDLKRSMTSKEAADVIQKTLLARAKAQEAMKFALYTKYLLLYSIEVVAANDAQPQSVDCADLELKANSTFYKQFQEIAALFSNEPCGHISFTCSYKCFTVSANLSSGTEVLRIATDELLQRSYYELAMAIKANALPDALLGIKDANKISLISHFETIREQVNREELAFPSAKEYLSQIAYAVTLTTKEHGLLFSASHLENLLNIYLSADGANERTQLAEILSQVERRLWKDHKFFRMNNRWRFLALLKNFQQCSGLYYVYADIHDLERGVQKLDQDLEPGTDEPFGNIHVLSLYAANFLEGSRSAWEFLRSSFDLRATGEELMNKWFEPLSRLRVALGGDIVQALYLHAADQVEGFARDVHQIRDGFKNATNATNGQMTAGVALVEATCSDSYDELHRRAEFCVDVTKLFKGTGTAWELEHIWGDLFDHSKAELALELLEKKTAALERDSTSNKKLLMRVIACQHWWLAHFAEQYRPTFVCIAARAEGLF